MSKTSIPHRLWLKGENGLRSLVHRVRFLRNVADLEREKVRAERVWEERSASARDLTFLIAHRHAPTFLQLCLESIAEHAAGLSYHVLVADDHSLENERAELRKMRFPHTTMFFLERNYSHAIVLEWLSRLARTPYVVTLDQDALLLAVPWPDLFAAFTRHDALLMMGSRALSRMLHPSFWLVHKARCDRRLRPPFFYSLFTHPSFSAYEPGIPCRETYYAFVCKALDHDPSAVAYFENFPTKYGFGTVCLFGDAPVAYHHWFSGRARVAARQHNDTVDAVIPVPLIKHYTEEFLSDLRKRRADFRPLGGSRIDPEIRAVFERWRPQVLRRTAAAVSGAADPRDDR